MVKNGAVVGKRNFDFIKMHGTTIKNYHYSNWSFIQLWTQAGFVNYN